MRKIGVILLSLVLLISLAACDSSNPDPEAVSETPLSEIYPDSDYANIVPVSTASELADALNNLAPDTKIVLSEGYYNMKDSVSADEFNGVTGWMFLINEDNVAIVAADDAEDVYIYSSDSIPNGAYVTQNMITVTGDNIVLAGLRIGERGSQNKAIEALGNNLIIDSCTFVDSAMTYIGEYNVEGAEWTIDAVTVKNSVFEDESSLVICNGVSGAIAVTDNTFLDGTDFQIIGSRLTGWNPVTVDVSEAVFSGNSFAAGATFTVTYDANDPQNDSLWSLDASSVASNFGEPEITKTEYEDRRVIHTAL